MPNHTLQSAFDRCRRENRKALVAYVTAGDPDLAATARLLPALAAAGADILEVGVPFSDPMADGPVIQAACQRALAAGATLPGILEMLRGIRDRLTAPVVLFSYYNVLLQYGIEKLAADSVAAGIAAWLVVDMPAEEAGEIEPALHKHGLCRITLLAPTTPPDRAARLAGAAKGFVYYITVTGVTGARSELPADLAANLETLQKLSAVPVVAGFGISSPEQARTVAAHAAGVVVGSALVKLHAEAGADAACRLVSDIARALRSPA